MLDPDRIRRVRNNALPVAYNRKNTARILHLTGTYRVEVRAHEQWIRLGNQIAECDYDGLVSVFEACSRGHFSQGHMNKVKKRYADRPELYTLYDRWRTWNLHGCKAQSQKERGVQATRQQRVDLGFERIELTRPMLLRAGKSYFFDLGVREVREVHAGNIRSVREARQHGRYR